MNGVRMQKIMEDISTTNKQKQALYIVLTLIFLVRLISISNPPLDYSSWRQVDTDSIARNFVEYRFNIFYPQLNYDGPMPNYAQLELQITTFIIAIFYRLFGYRAFIGRIIPIIFFMFSCYFLYMIVKRKSGIKCAIITVLSYGMLPINIVYSRNIMPESSMMFFMLGALYYFILWIDEEKIRHYLLASAFTALTVLTKPPSALIGVPMIYIVFEKYGRKAFKNIYLYLFLLIAFCPAGIYFSWLGGIAEHKFASGIGAGMILPNIINPILKLNSAKYLSEQFVGEVFTVPGAVLFSIGVLSKKVRNEPMYYAWLGAAILHVFIIDSSIHLDYYLMFITPIISIFMGCAVASILYESGHNSKYYCLIYLSLLILILHDAVFLKEAYKLKDDYQMIGSDIEQRTRKNDLIIIANDSPELLYTSDRKGWRLHGDSLTPENVEELSSYGAKYFVPYDINDELMRYLDANYKKIIFPDGYFIYILH